MITMFMMDIVSSATQNKEEILYSKENYNNVPKIAHIRLNKIATIIE